MSRHSCEDSGPSSLSAKIVLLGDTGTGKTCLVRRYAFGTFPNFPIPMLTTALTSKSKGSGLQDAMGVCICYSVDDARSFENISSWVNVVNARAPANVIRILVANKSDVDDTLRVISTEQGQAEARKLHMHFIETSAKNGNNVDKCFRKLAKRVLEQQRQQQRPDANAARAAGSVVASIPIPRSTVKKAVSWWASFCSTLSPASEPTVPPAASPSAPSPAPTSAPTEVSPPPRSPEELCAKLQADCDALLQQVDASPALNQLSEALNVVVEAAVRSGHLNDALHTYRAAVAEAQQHNLEAFRSLGKQHTTLLQEVTKLCAQLCTARLLPQLNALGGKLAQLKLVQSLFHAIPPAVVLSDEDLALHIELLSAQESELKSTHAMVQARIALVRTRNDLQVQLAVAQATGDFAAYAQLQPRLDEVEAECRKCKLSVGAVSGLEDKRESLLERATAALVQLVLRADTDVGVIDTLSRMVVALRSMGVTNFGADMTSTVVAEGAQEGSQPTASATDTEHINSRAGDHTVQHTSAEQHDEFELNDSQASSPANQLDPVYVHS